jgi:hypothetical protein
MGEVSHDTYVRLTTEDYLWTVWRILHMLSIFAPATSIGWGYGSRRNTLPVDFILVAQKLEKLGFVYHKGKVVIVEREQDE